MKEADVKKVVRAGYAEIAKKGDSCCSCGPSGCSSTNTVEAISKQIGYNEEDMQAVPEGANLGLGCGNPHISHYDYIEQDVRCSTRK